MKVLVVDDEAPARDRLKRLLASHPEIQIQGEAANGLDALNLAVELQPDLLFLDIDMPELGGLEVARALGPTGPAIVFVTAHDEFALKAFETNALDYLVKPVNPGRLQLTIQKLAKPVSEKSRSWDTSLTSLLESKPPLTRMTLKIGKKFELFETQKLAAVQARDHYSECLIEGRTLLSDETLESLEKRLDPKTFIRVHRSALLNIAFLKELRREGDRKYVAVLSSPLKAQIPVSRERLPFLKEILGIN